MSLISTKCDVLIKPNQRDGLRCPLHLMSPDGSRVPPDGSRAPPDLIPSSGDSLNTLSMSHKANRHVIKCFSSLELRSRGRHAVQTGDDLTLLATGES